jgi:hypothetical protein
LSDLTSLIKHDGLRRLYRYWLSKRAGNVFPSRRDIDPADLAFILGNVILLDVLQEPLGFRFRLMGSHLTQRTGYDLTGRFIDDIPDPERRDFAKAFYGSVVQQRRPQAAQRERIFDNATWSSEFVAMPLSTDGDSIDMLLVGNVFVDGG